MRTAEKDFVFERRAKGARVFLGHLLDLTANAAHRSDRCALEFGHFHRGIEHALDGGLGGGSAFDGRVTLMKAVFLKILKGVPISLSFLTIFVDLSKSITTPVAVTRKSFCTTEVTC